MTLESCKRRVPWNKGLKGQYHLSDEHREKISEAHRGKHHSEESKRKISESNKGQISWLKGKYLSEEHKMRIGQSHKGKCLSEETKRKISESRLGEKNPMYGKVGERSPRFGRSSWNCGLAEGSQPMFGKYLSEDARCKISETHIGERNPQWLGGISFLPYPSVFNKNLKESIKQRDSYKCQTPSCGYESRILDVHHIDYDKNNCSPSNLVSLCGNCHLRSNHNREEWQHLYNDIVQQKYCFRVAA